MATDQHLLTMLRKLMTESEHPMVMQMFIMVAIIQHAQEIAGMDVEKLQKDYINPVHWLECAKEALIEIEKAVPDTEENNTTNH